MGWHLLETVLQQVGEHSTLVGKLWVTATFVFRFIIVASVGDAVYSDEQSDFTCNTQQPGCENVCFNQFSPISHLRFWAAQIIAVSTPSIIFVVYTMHVLLKMPQESEEEFQDDMLPGMENDEMPMPQATPKRRRGGRGSGRKSGTGGRPKESIGMVRGFTNPPAEATEIIEEIKVDRISDDENTDDNDDGITEVTGIEDENAKEISELDRELELLNTLAPAPGNKEKKIKKSIQVAYTIALLLRTGTECIFLWLQMSLYGFTVPELFKCFRSPCPNVVDCYISRPREKTILLLFMFAVAVVCLFLNIIEIHYLGIKRITKVLCHSSNLNDDTDKSEHGNPKERGDLESQISSSKDNYFNMNNGATSPSAPNIDPTRLCSVVKYPDDLKDELDNDKDSIGFSMIGERPAYPTPGYPYVHRYGMILNATPPPASYL